MKNSEEPRTMQRVTSRDVVFDVPEDWEDRSVTAFAAPSQAGRPVAPNIVLTRDVANGSDPVASYADRQLVELAKRLDGFKLIRRFEGSLAAQPSVELTFTWSGPSGLIRQRQIFVLRGRSLMTFVLTALESDYPKQEQKFDAMLSSVHFP